MQLYMQFFTGSVSGNQSTYWISALSALIGCPKPLLQKVASKCCKVLCDFNKISFFNSFKIIHIPWYHLCTIFDLGTWDILKRIIPFGFGNEFGRMEVISSHKLCVIKHASPTTRRIYWPVYYLVIFQIGFLSVRFIYEGYKEVFNLFYISIVVSIYATRYVPVLSDNLYPPRVMVTRGCILETTFASKADLNDQLLP